MMTSEQIQQLRRDEAAMMAEWSASSVQPRCFNTDGIVDYELWSALPDGKHIVVLLKETNGLHGSLVEFLYHGGSKTYYRTWNNVARWANMILNGTYWEFVPKSLLDDMVRNIAVVNLKKVSGRCHRKLKSGTAGHPAGCGPTETSDTALRTGHHPDRRLGAGIEHFT